MNRLAASAMLLACLLPAGTTKAQRLYCTPPTMLRHPDGAPLHIQPGQSRLTHFVNGDVERPRLVYQRRRPGRDAAHDLLVLEGGGPQLFNTHSDVEVRLPATVFAGYSAPWIDAFELAGKWLLMAVSDGRTGIPLLARAPAQVLLVELLPRAEVAAVHVLGSYWSDGRSRVPHVRALHIDREPAPTAPGPLVAWCVTDDSWRSDARDDIYFVRVSASGPLTAPMQAHVAAPGWNRLESFTATEAAGRETGPAFLISATSAAAQRQEIGIFAATALRGSPRSWLDEAGDEVVLDRLHDRVFYLAPGRLGDPRVHMSVVRAGEEPRLSWRNDDLTPSRDTGLVLSRATGYSRRTFPHGQPTFSYGMIESRANATLPRPPGRSGEPLAIAEVSVFELSSPPVPLRSLLQLPAPMCAWAQGLSRNLCVVTAAPQNGNHGEMRYDDFVDAAGDPVAFWFHLGY